LEDKASKSESGRTIPMNKELEAALEVYQAMHIANLVIIFSPVKELSVWLLGAASPIQLSACTLRWSAKPIIYILF